MIIMMAVTSITNAWMTPNMVTCFICGYGGDYDRLCQS